MASPRPPNSPAIEIVILCVGIDNLIALCPHHHRLHHRGKLGITGNADEIDGVTFTNKHGHPIAQTGAKPEPPAGPPPKPASTYEHPYGEPIQTRWFHLNVPPEHR